MRREEKATSTGGGMLDRWGAWAKKRKKPLVRVQVELAYSTRLLLEEEERLRNRPLSRLRALEVKKVPKSKIVREIFRAAALHRKFPATRYFKPADSRSKFRVEGGALEELELMLAEVNKAGRLGNLLVSKQRFLGAVLAAGLARLEEDRQKAARRKQVEPNRPATSSTPPPPIRESVLMEHAYNAMLSEEQERRRKAAELFTKLGQWEEAHDKGVGAMIACRLGWFWAEHVSDAARQWVRKV